jgi:cytochrome c peroxidase
LNQGDEFKEAFAGETDPITVDHFAKAIGAFERPLVTPSHFDSFLKGDIAALGEQEKMGLKTYMETRCIMCHSGPDAGGPVYQKSGIFEPYWKYTKSEPIDEGKHVATKNEADKYVLSLFNIFLNFKIEFIHTPKTSLPTQEDLIWGLEVSRPF